MAANPVYGDPMLNPVNRTAKRVLGGGFTYESSKKITQAHWSTPPKMCRPPLNTPQLIGVEFGRFTVIGWFAEGKKSWVVRCVCGNYETRKAKAIRNPNNTTDACQVCRHVMHLQHRQERKKSPRTK